MTDTHTHTGWWLGRGWGSLCLLETTAEEHQSIFGLPSFVTQKEVQSLWDA